MSTSRLVIGGGSAGLVATAVVLLLLDASPTVAVAVLSVVAVATLVGTSLVLHRAEMAVTSTNRRRLRTAVASLDEVRGALRDGERTSKARAARVDAVERQVRSESAELSRQLAALRSEVASSHDDILALLTQVSSRQTSEPATVVAPPRAVAGTGSVRVMDPDALTTITRDARERSVVLVLDSFTPQQLFAGVRTAVVLATALAGRLGAALHVVVMREPSLPAAQVEDLLRSYVAQEAGDASVAATLRLTLAGDGPLTGFHADDVWLATYWSTARAVGRAVAAGTARRELVVYLVQDWEPAFFPWSDQYSAARATYDLGFTHVVNSAPLAQYFARHTGQEVPEVLVVRPQIDESRLMTSAARWMPSDPHRPRLLFYARPAKPRNLFSLGVQALERWVLNQPDATRPIVRVVGEAGVDLDLGPGADVENLGKLSLDGYHDLVADTDLALALMHSPHPSHLPLELAMAGVPVVTNSFESYRRPWLPGLTVAEPDADALADALVHEQRRAVASRVHVFEPLPPILGVPVATTVGNLARMLTDGVTP